MSIKSTISYTFEKEDGEEVELELTFTMSDYDPGVSYGPPERCYPPEGGEIEVIGCVPDCHEFWARHNDERDFARDIDERCAEKGMERERSLEGYRWDD